METSRKLPTWLLGITVIYSISNLFVFGISAMLFPSFAFPDAGEAAAFPIQFFAIRHIALAAPLIYGLVKQDVKVLIVCYSVFLIMSVLDVSLLFINGYYIPIIGDLPLAGKIVLSLVGFLLPVIIVLKKLTSYEI